MQSEQRPMCVLSVFRHAGLEIPLRKKSIPIEKFLGRRATLVVNIKLDDPESRQIGELKYLVDKYWKQGQRVTHAGGEREVHSHSVWCDVMQV